MSTADLPQLQFAPLRPLDDFLLESARFQLPNFNDFEKWGNRVIKNLIYYQTNYFALAATIFTLFGLFHPFKILVGISLLIAIVFASYRLAEERKKKDPVQIPNNWTILAVGGLVCYFILYIMNCIVIVSLSLLLPISAIFVHSSLRKRNIKNKVANITSTINNDTPMARFLKEMNLLPETLTF